MYFVGVLLQCLLLFRIDCVCQPTPTLRCVVPKYLHTFDCPCDMNQVSEPSTNKKTIISNCMQLIQYRHIFLVRFQNGEYESFQSAGFKSVCFLADLPGQILAKALLGKS